MKSLSSNNRVIIDCDAHYRSRMALSQKSHTEPVTLSLGLAIVPRPASIMGTAYSQASVCAFFVNAQTATAEGDGNARRLCGRSMKFNRKNHNESGKNAYDHVNDVAHSDSCQGGRLFIPTLMTRLISVAASLEQEPVSFFRSVDEDLRHGGSADIVTIFCDSVRETYLPWSWQPRELGKSARPPKPGCRAR